MFPSNAYVVNRLLHTRAPRACYQSLPKNSHSYDVVFLLLFNTVFSVILSFLVPVFCVRFVVNGDPCLIYFNVVYYQDNRS